jgi:hypothetical protein
MKDVFVLKETDPRKPLRKGRSWLEEEVGTGMEDRFARAREYSQDPGSTRRLSLPLPIPQPYLPS